MIKPLTSLRFFFAFIVFLSHLRFLDKGEHVFLKNLFNDYLKEGSIGVSFFFILSGYILAYTYQDKLIAQKVSLKDFYIARIARIYPLYLFSIVISIYFTLGELLLNDPLLWFGKLALSLCMIQSFIPAPWSYYAFNPPNWSISAEAFFYLMFPLIALVAARRHKLRWLIFSVALVSIPVAMQFVDGYLTEFSWFYIHPFTRLVDFALGIAVYNIAKRLGFNTVKDRMMTVLEIAVCLLLGLFILYHGEVDRIYRYSCYYWLPMSLMIFIFSFQRGFLSKILSHRALMLLGEISFAFYLVHWQMIDYLGRASKKWWHISDPYIMIALAFFVSLIMAYLCHIFIEKPMNRRIKRRFSSSGSHGYPHTENPPVASLPLSRTGAR